MLRIGWFSTGGGEGSRGLLRLAQESIGLGQLDARIEFVFSNREPGEAEGSDQFFKLVQGYRLPLVTLSSTKFRRSRGGGPIARHREEYDRQVMGLLREYQPGIGVLAGYMLIVGSELCHRYPLLNLHPALPEGPVGTWREVIWQLIEQEARLTGAMVHLATQEVDRGPVVAYCTVPITGEPFDRYWQALAQQALPQVKDTQGEQFPLFQQIRQAEYRREPYLLVETLRAVAAGHIVIRNGEVLYRRQHPSGAIAATGLCLDEEIAQAIAQGEGQRQA
jgi:folate-dependent phosphoribosylglycinamide formyltransferase PurN